MNRQRQSRGLLILALLMWIGSWFLVFPIPHSLTGFPSQAVNWWGFFYIITPPYEKFGSPTDGWIVNNSLYIGFVILLVTSFVVVRVAGGARWAKFLVALTDAVITAITLLIAWP
jgi:hypothetical protein